MKQIDKEVTNYHKLISSEVERLKNAQLHHYDTDYAFINAPQDIKCICAIQTLAAQKLSLKPTLLIIIGIGGSNLATAALVQALFGVLYNENSHIKIYFADTTDSDYINEIVQRAETELKKGNSILLNVISKSGVTTETIANFQLFINLLKKYHTIDYKKYVVISSDTNSPLHQYAQKEKIDFFEIPAKIGGRYSAFTAVSLFPLALLGVDIEMLCVGAQSGLQMSLATTDTINNSAAQNAVTMYSLYKKGYTTHNSFFFSVALEGLGKWYRQLMAESIGKLYDKQNNVVHNGILPIVSIGSTDLHSVAQLYLSGPHTIFTTFISIDHAAHDYTLHYDTAFNTIAPAIQNKSFTTIMNAILEGTKKAYEHDKRPFVHVHIPEKNPYYLGQFMQIKMCEIVYLGFLMNINPFDQPQVELYKKEVKKII